MYDVVQECVINYRLLRPTCSTMLSSIGDDDTNVTHFLTNHHDNDTIIREIIDDHCHILFCFFATRSPMSENVSFDHNGTTVTLSPDQYKDFLLDTMITNDASDMYLTIDEPPVLRINNTLTRMDKLPMFDKESISYLAYMLMNEFQGEKFREELDLDMGLSYKQRRFRINISHQQ